MWHCTQIIRFYYGLITYWLCKFHWAEINLPVTSEMSLEKRYQSSSSANWTWEKNSVNTKNIQKHLQHLIKYQMTHYVLYIEIRLPRYNYNIFLGSGLSNTLLSHYVYSGRQREKRLKCNRSTTTCLVLWHVWLVLARLAQIKTDAGEQFGS